MLDKYIDPTNGKKLFLPELNKPTKFNVFYGYTQLLVLKHQVQDKNTAISLPNLSDCKEKNQKIGEMEMLALEAHGCSNMINELTTIRSNHESVREVFNDILSNKKLHLDGYKYKYVNPSFKEFSVIFRSMGLKLVKKVK